MTVEIAEQAATAVLSGARGNLWEDDVRQAARIAIHDSDAPASHQYNLARTAAIDELRTVTHGRARIRLAYAEDIPDTGNRGDRYDINHTTALASVENELGPAIIEHLGHLAPDDRQIAALYGLGWTLAEIGQRFGVTESRISQRLKRIRQEIAAA